MKVLKIVIDQQPKYYRWEADREYFRPGESVTGHVQFDPPGARPPASTRVLWTDSYGRLVHSTAGKWNAGRARLEFEFAPDGQVALANYLEVELGGARQGRERFVVTRPLGPWDEYRIFTWAHYPYGYYDELRKMGVQGQIAYKRQPFEHIIENDFYCYVDQVSPDELSVYHRPYFQYWEIPAKLTHPERRHKWFTYHWDMIRQRYKRARARLKGLSVALDAEGQKTLWRASCPSDRGVQEKMRERIVNTVLQHKGVRPMFYNLADEHGTGDQGAPFDFCYCKHCLERFRVWLERRHGTLAELNRQWGTAFRLWREVIPLTADDTLRQQAERGDFNFSSWADHREFMDDVITGALAQMREFGRGADPSAVYGSTGGQGPGAYGGWDFAKIAKSVDLHVPYNVFQNDEMLRSFRPRILKMAPYFGDDPGLVRRMWYQLFHGDCGQIHWDNDEPKGRFLDQPRRRWTKRARMFAPVLRELTGGIGKQIMSMQASHEDLAIHHSQASVRAHWFMGTIPQGEKWVDRDSSDCEAVEHDVLWHLRDSLVRLVADCGLQYRFLAYDAVEKGALAADGFQAFFLPHSLAMSAAECAAVRKFAEAGGVVIADALPAVMDEHCRLLPTGQLDGFFGVRRKRFDYRVSGGAIRVRAGGPLGLPEGRLALRACEPTLRAVGDAAACGTAGSADCLIVRRVGRGLAIYLNAELRGYFLRRYDLGSARRRGPQELLAAVLRPAGIRREISLLTRDGQQVPGAELTRFASGPVELVCAVANVMRGTTGVGEELAVKLRNFDRPSAMTVKLPAAAHVYDARTGKYHGLVRKFDDRFDPMDAKAWALLPYRVAKLSARVAGAVRTGACARVEIRLETDPAEPAGRHVVRADVYDPRGRWASYYSKNLVTEGGRGELLIPFAESDRPGRWRLELRDAVSGQQASVRLKVLGR